MRADSDWYPNCSIGQELLGGNVVGIGKDDMVHDFGDPTVVPPPHKTHWPDAERCLRLVGQTI